MNKRKLNTFGGISGAQLIVVLIVALLTWFGVDYYNKYKESKENNEGMIIALPNQDELNKLKSEYETLKKQLFIYNYSLCSTKF